MMDQRGMVPWRPASTHFLQELTPKQRKEEILLQPFYDEQKRQAHARRLHEIKSMEAVSQMRDHRRLLIHQAFQERVKQRRLKELFEVSTHASLLTSWDILEKQDFATVVDVSEKMTRELNLEMNMDRHNFEESMKLFESKGYELGADAAIDMSLESNKDKGKEKRKDTNKGSKETKSSKNSKPNDLLDSTQDGSNVLSNIKERVLRAEKEKFEAEQNRRLGALKAKQIEREIQESTRKREEDEKLLRDQQDQGLKAEELQAAEDQEKEKIALRLELVQQIAEQRSREWEAVLARDHELLLMMKHDRESEVNFEQRLWQEERLKRLEQKQLKHRNLCHEVLLQIISLAESSAIYKASTNCALSTMEWWEWKNLFVKGAIQPVDLNTESRVMDALIMEEDEVAEKLCRQLLWITLKNKESGNLFSQLEPTKSSEIS